MKNKSLV